MSNYSKFKATLHKILNMLNIFDIPRLTREISCDVKLIRDKYDETIKAIDDYKKELEIERDKRARERNLYKNKLFLWFYRAKGGSNVFFNIIRKMLYI